METKVQDYIKNIEGAERRFFSSEVRKLASNDEGSQGAREQPTIEGYAAKYNSPTVIGYYYKYEETIALGAFDDVLNDDVRCLFNHSPNYVLARSINGEGTLKLESDDTGLKYSYVTPNRSFANDLADAIASGDVSQSSFAFEVSEEKWTIGDPEKGVLDKREIVKFKKLYDVSPVTYPAYEDTEVAQRSIESIKNEQNTKGRFQAGQFTEYDAVVQMNKNLL